MKGWLDNFGKADNANDSNVSLPEGFVGLGYNTKGRNYSPAWGGQFAMGGSLPGATGMMYARYEEGGSLPGDVGFSYPRTTDSAPSKGKYAKKTMASAQNGIMSPLLLGRKILEYIYPSEEAANTVEAAPANYKKGLTNELLQRQAYKESTFNPSAVSPAGYKGLTQIGEGVLEDYSNKKGGKKLDPFNPKDAVELQKFAMDDLYNASFINKPDQSDSVRIAKTLAAYNWGRGNLANYLNEQKSKGIDIYDSYDWLNNLPKETSDYVNKILLQEDPSFNKNYKKASTNPKYEEVTSLYDQKKFGGDIPSAQKGKKVSKDATRVDSNASDKFWGIQRELDAQNLSDDSFREKYGMPLHQFKMRDSEYASAFNRQMEQRRMSDPNYAELNLPQTDVRSKIYQGNPNLRFIPGTSDGESRAAMEDLFLATTTATAPLLPVNTAKIAKGAQQFGKYLTDDTFLKNAWRLNPKAYQYNLPENAMWRGIGKEGMEDALSSGVFRAKQNIEPSNYRNSSLNLNKSFGANTYFTPKFKVAGSYGPDYLAEVPRTSANWRNRYAKSDWSQIADRQIPISEGRILQKNWLEGYKEVPQNRVFKSGLPNPIEIVDKIIPRPLAPGSFFGLDDSWNNYSPLNLIPGYGKKLIDNSSTYPNFVGFRKFGNSIDDVIESQSLRPRGSGMGSNQIRSEGNWAESGKVNENYPGVFEATMNPQIPGSNIKLEKISKRNGILGTTNEGDVEIPITDPGLSFNRRLPFSNRYAPIDKEKLINNQFQMSTVAPNLQSLAEKYAIWSGLGLGASSLGYPQLSDANKKYIIDPAVEKYKDLDERLYKLYDQILPSLEIPKKQNGGEMRFYQNGLDWKPKSMQRGGDAEKISINDHRYPELYKNRQVGSYYDGAFTLPDLPEFVVEGKDESLKEAMSQGSGRFLQGLAGVIGAPQAVTMELLTGKQQTPSEAFGFQQPGGWLDSYSSFGKNLGNLAMDAVLDPVNLLGVGLVDDVARGTARALSNPIIKETAQEFIPEKIVFDLMDESIDPFKETLKNIKIDNTPSPFAKDVRREAFKYQQLASDPRYLERVKNIDRDFGSKLEPLLNQFKNDEIENVSQYFPFNISVADRIPYSYGGDEVDVLGISGLNTEGFIKDKLNKKAKRISKITPSTDRYIEINEPRHIKENIPARGTVHHELKHHWTNALNDPENKNYSQALKNLISRRSELGIDPRDVTANQNYNYLSSPTEVDAYLMTNLRDDMVNRGYLKDHFDELTEDKLNDFILKEKDIRDVKEYFSPGREMIFDRSKFVDFFNKYGLPSTVIGGVLGGQSIDQQKNGGITKDNQGYWNPDNWGKPVEIDSNDITMEGVYEPLLGVSDTGDTKLMKPGKNYKFKGKKVTEFPVAKLGINQLDAQPMKKLNQLLNFTNNPDKDNWLDKYN